MLFFFLFAFSLGSDCPVYQCVSLGTNVCMTWTLNSISFNANGCSSSKYTCSYSKAMTAYKFNPPGGTVYCEPTSDFPSISGFTYCGSDSIYKRNLASGTYPKACNDLGFSDPNCQLEDGSYAECVCGFDSNTYCQPNPNSYVFSQYWTSCQHNDYVVPSTYFQYYEMLYNYYVENNSKKGLNCTASLFREFSIIAGNPPPMVNFARVIGVSFVLLNF